MTGFILKLLDISVVTCFIICAVIVLRLCFKKAPAYLRCMLWGLVALRLILPVSIESGLSLIPSETPVSDYIGSAMQQPTPQKPDYTPELITPPAQSTAPVIKPDNTQPEKPTPEGVVPPYENDAPVTDTPVTTPSDLPTASAKDKQETAWEWIAFYVWVAGIGLMTGYMLLSYIWIRKKVKNSVLHDERVYIFNGNASPFILGVIKPKIFVPCIFNNEQLDCILAHERAHIARGDHLLKPFAFLLLALYWFNPLMWVAYILFCKDIELACDEKVIARLDVDKRRLYSVTLLACSTKRYSLVSPLAFGEVGVKERIRNVMNYKKASFWIICIALISAVAAAVFFITSPYSETDNSSADISEEISAEISEEDTSADEFTKTEKTLEELKGGDIPDGAMRYIDNTIKGKVIKLSFSTDITDFKILAVTHRIKGDSPANSKTEEVFQTLCSVDKLTAGTPFYVNVGWDKTAYYTSVTRAIEFTNANGTTERYYIRHDSLLTTLTPPTTEEGPKNYPTFYLSAVSELDEAPITVQYVNLYQSTKGFPVYTDEGKADELIEMYIGNTVTDFKILAVSWSKDAEPSFKPLFERDSAKGNIYYKTSLPKDDSLTSVTRAIEFINPAGNKMRYYLRTHKYNTPDLFPYTVYLQSVTSSSVPAHTHASIEFLALGGGIDDGVLYNDFDRFTDSIRISVDTIVTDFKFLSVSWDGNNTPVFQTLFYAGTITPEKPFYAQTFIAMDSALTSVDRAIEYKIAGGETERFYIKAEVGSGQPFYSPLYSYHWTLTLKPVNTDVKWANPDKVTLYVPEKDGYSFKTVTAECGGTPAGIIQALTKVQNKVLPEGIEVNSFHMVNGVAIIDLNKAFEDFIKTDALSEHQGIGTVVNTLLGYYGAERVFITVDGMRLERADGRQFSRPIGFYTAEGDSTAKDTTKYATLYLANINTFQSYPYPAVVDGTPQGLIDALIEAGELREGVVVNFFEIKDNIIYLDLNHVFFEQVDAGLMAEIAKNVVSSTFYAYYKAQQPIKHVVLTMDGKPHQSDYA